MTGEHYIGSSRLSFTITGSKNAMSFGDFTIHEKRARYIVHLTLNTDRVGYLRISEPLVTRDDAVSERLKFGRISLSS